MRRSFSLRWQDADYMMVPGSFTIGRSSGCDLVVDDPRVSRVHAVIRVGIDSAVVEDAGSQNGVTVNGSVIDQPHALADGDTIGVGDEVFRLSSVERPHKRKSRDQTMPSQQVAAVEQAVARAGREELLARLSRREREVVALVAQGHTLREIAEQLGLSPKTVEGYRARVADKLDLRSRAELVRFAVEAGLLGG